MAPAEGGGSSNRRSGKISVGEMSSIIKDQETAKKYLTDKGFINKDSPINMERIQGVLLVTAQHQGIPQVVTNSLLAAYYLLEELAIDRIAQDITEKIKEKIKSSADRIQATVSSAENVCMELRKASEDMDLQRAKAAEILEANKKLVEEMAESSKKVLNEVGAASQSLGDATKSLGNSATSYRDALLQGSNTQIGRASLNPLEDMRIRNREAIRACQILVDYDFPRTAEAMKKNSQEEILAKACDALKSAQEGLDTAHTIKALTRLTNGGLLFELSSAEATKWIMQPENGDHFIQKFDPNALIRRRNFTVIIPFVPLTFDPRNPAHIREVEETNNIEMFALTRMRHIKPAEQRDPKARCAHVMLVTESAELANQLIIRGIHIGGRHLMAQKNKKEPTRCLKCQRYGHIATSCTAGQDICGTCGMQHQTSACDLENGVWCIECNENTHASWDRNCPSFCRRCDDMDRRYVENSMPFFPTEEEWTRATQPPKQVYVPPNPRQIRSNPSQANAARTRQSTLASWVRPDPTYSGPRRGPPARFQGNQGTGSNSAPLGPRTGPPRDNQQTPSEQNTNQEAHTQP